MKKLLSLLLALSLLLSLAPAALALGEGEAHTGQSYLTDTLTFAGSGMGGVKRLTVAEIEALAADPALGYSGIYSLLTSGSVRSQPTFTGLRLYELLEYMGLDASLPDATPVKAISKDGYTIPLTLGALRAGYARFASTDASEPDGTGLPVLAAFASNGCALVGPTGTEPVTKKFTEAEGYNTAADNTGGPIRLVIGQTQAAEFNAPLCSKWLAAIVVGDADGYVYTRDTGESDLTEPDASGDWTHSDGAFADYALTISGTESTGAVRLSLGELEAMGDIITREYYAASAGKNAFEGLILRELLKKYLAPGVDIPTRITILAADGFVKELDTETVFGGIDSAYQPGRHKDVLLAYAIDGAPLVPSASDAGYTGANAFGPLRLVVENTISSWVKGVTGIVLGEPEYFRDLSGCPWARESVEKLFDMAVIDGAAPGEFDPYARMRRGDFMLMLARALDLSADASDNFADVAPGSYWYDAIAAARALGIAQGDGENFRPDAPISREDALTLLYRALLSAGRAPTGRAELSRWPDGADISPYALTAFEALVSAGVIEGSDAGLEPKKNMTRAEMAVALLRALEVQS